MEAADFYNLRKKKGFLSCIIRLFVFINLKIRPPRLFPSRNQQVSIYNRFFDKDAQVLLLGSNLSKEFLTKFNTKHLKQLDIKKFENVDIVVDAEIMSSVLGHNSYDYIVACKMLEHTPHPWKVIEEISKVLKPGGILYLSVPWIFPVHAEPYDFFRFSIFALKSLVKDAGLLEIECGSEESSHAAFHIFIKYYLCEIFSFNNSMVFYSLEYFFSWVLYPLEIIEGLLGKRKRTVYYIDSGLYIIAQKYKKQV
jgi:SAM-dependent methyltransferase